MHRSMAAGTGFSNSDLLLLVFWGGSVLGKGNPKI